MKSAFNWKRRLANLIRYSLLIDGFASALFSLLTVFPIPARFGWAVGIAVPECGHWFAAFPFGFAVGALLLGRKHRVVTGVTVVLCAVAAGLFLKPLVEARGIAREVPGKLAEAFGPVARAADDPAPFSVRTAYFGRNPEPVAVETMEYAPSLRLDFYRAVGRSGVPVPCVVAIHGGSWVGGNRLNDGTTRYLNDSLARRGYAVASIDYRLAPQFPWPAQREDLIASLAFLRANAQGLGIDANRFVLLGRSAGAQMATATAYSVHDPTIRGVIALYTPADFRLTWEAATVPGNLDHRLNLEWFLGGTPESAPDAYASASAAGLVTPAAPPTLLLHGGLDINVFPEHSQLLAERLGRAGVPQVLVSFPSSAHAFDLVSFNSPAAQISTYAVHYFVDAVTR